MTSQSVLAVLRRSTPPVALLATAALTASACRLNVDLGETVTEEFDVATFDAIRVDAPFDVTIRQGDTQRVEVEVGENLLDDLTVEVENGELRIDIDSGVFGFNGDLEARITVVDLDALDLSSASDTVLSDLAADQLTIALDGASELSMSGEIERLELSVSGASNADFTGTSIDDVRLDVSGASNVDFDENVADIEGSLSGASELSVESATNVRVDTSGASSIDRN